MLTVPVLESKGGAREARPLRLSDLDALPRLQAPDGRQFPLCGGLGLGPGIQVVSFRR